MGGVNLFLLLTGDQVVSGYVENKKGQQNHLAWVNVAFQCNTFVVAHSVVTLDICTWIYGKYLELKEIVF